MLRLLLSSMLLLAALPGCQRSVLTAASVSAVAVKAPPEKPAMVFLTFRAVAAGAGQAARLTLLSSQAAPGRLKAQPAISPSYSEYLAVKLLDSTGQPIGEATLLEHPLRKTVEYTDEKQQLSRRLVSLPEAEFFVRLSLPAQATQVRVEEFAATTLLSTSSFPLHAK